MANYNWTTNLKAIYDKAVAQYREGKRGADTFFNAEELSFLRSIGHTAQELYDFAEDLVNRGEPDWETFLLIAAVRRDYFMVVQEGKLSDKVIMSDTLPAKDEAADGIVWLPRIIEKAKIKLRGEMNPDLMYGCGGDRKFFADNNVPPADFLRHVWASDGDDQKVVDYVKSCRS